MMTDVSVLLIDDDPIDRKALASYLETVAEFKVTSFADGHTAIEHLRTAQRDYTAVLLDYVLKAEEMSGRQVLQQIRAKHPQLPVIVFTGLDPERGVQALSEGAYRYLRKPLDRVELVNILGILAEQSTIYYEVARDAKNMLDADVSIVWQLNRRKRRFHVAACDGTLDNEFRKKMYLDLDSDATQEFFAAERPILLPDIEDKSKAQHYQYREKAIKRGWKSLISLPIKRQQRIIGLVDSYFFEQPQLLSGWKHWRDKILPAFANQAAEALRNAELSTQFQALQGFNEVLAGTFKENVILDQILAKALELVGSDIGWIFAVDTQSRKLVLKSCEGVPEEHIDSEREFGAGITGWVAQKGEALNVKDVSEPSEEYQHIRIPGVQVRSEVAVPMRREEQTLGVLTVKSPHPQAFTEEDVNLLRALSAQAALVIERAKLTKHLQQVSRLALAGDYDRLAEYIVQVVPDLTGADVILWTIPDQAKGKEHFLQITASNRKDTYQVYGAGATVPITLGSSLTALALERGEPIILSDIKRDTGFHEPGRALKMGWRSFMTVPLLGQSERPLGSLSLYSNHVAKFEWPEAELMQTFAAQAAIALESVRRRRKLESLATVGSTVLRETAKGLRPVLETVAHAALEFTSADYAAIFTYDPQRPLFYDPKRVVICGLEESENHEVKGDKARERGVTAIVRRLGEIVVNDVQKGTIAPVSLQAIREQGQDLDGILPRIRESHFIQNRGIQSFVGLSLRAGVPEAGTEQEEVGILYIDFASPHRFSQEELDAIRIFGHQVGSAIQIMRYLEEAERQADGHKALNQAGSALAGLLDEEKILKEVAHAATAALDCSHCSVFRVKESNLVLAAVEGKRDELQPGRTFGLGQGVAGWVAEKGQSTLVPNTLDDERFDPGWSQEWSPQSLVVTPIMLEGGVYGVISAEQDRPAAFGEYDERLLQTLALQASQALRSAHRYEQRVQDMSALQQINETILQGSLSKIFDLVAEKAKQSMGADYSVLRLVDDSRQSLIFKASTDPERRQDPLSIDDSSFTGAVALSEEARMCGDIKQAKAERRMPYLQWYDEVESCMAAPMMVDEQLIGTLYVESTRLHAFSEEAQLDLLQAFANQAAIAIENSRLVRELEERATHLESLQRATTMITAQSTDLDLVLNLIVKSVNDMFSGASCVIRLYDPATDQFTHRVAAGPLEDQLKFTPRSKGTGISRHIIENKEPLYLDDTEAEQPGGQPAIRDEMLDMGVRAIAYHPLLSKGDVIGILYLNLLTPYQFSSNEELVLELLVDQAAIAVENARLYEDLAKRVNQLAIVSKVAQQTTSILGLEDLFRQVVATVKTQFAYHSVSLFLLDETGDTLRLAALAGKFEERARLVYSQSIEDGLIGWTARNVKPLLVPDVRQDPRYVSGYLEEELTGSELAVPITLDEQLVGVLDVQDEEINAFDAADLTAMEALAAQIAVAIGNAHLYEQRVKDIEALSEVNDAVASEELETILQKVVEKAIDVMPGDYASLWLRDLETGDLVLQALCGPAELIAHKGDRLEAGKDSTCQRVVETGKSKIYKNVKLAKGYYRIYEKSRSSVTTPLKYHDDVIGALNVESSQLRAFTAEHCRLLESFADQAAIAIESARLFARVKEQTSLLEALYETGKAITLILDLNDLLEQIARWATALTGADKALVLHVDAEAERLLNIVGSGFTRDQLADTPYQEISDGISGWVLREGSPTISSDILTDPRNTGLALEAARREHPRGKSVAVAPLSVRSKTIGTLTIVNNVGKSIFGQQDLDFVTMLADQAAIAIENARLYKELSERNEQLSLSVARQSAVSEVGRQLTASIRLSEAEILNLLHEQASRVMDTDNMYIALYDASTDTVRFPLAYLGGREVDTDTEEGWQPRAGGHGRTEWIIHEREPLLDQTRAEGEAWYEEPGREEYIGQPFASWIGVPMMIGDRVLGVIATYHATEEYMYDEDDEQVLSMMASYAAVALDNARLFQELDRRVAELDKLQELGEELSVGAWLGEM